MAEAGPAGLPGPVTTGQLANLVHQGVQLVGSGDRADLRRRLDLAMGRLTDPSIRVIVVGEFKQGKSKLINALVNAPVCPVD
ncbi:MAG: Isoniazid-inducible protein iniA, partial [Actinomycetes bacterium]